MDSSLGKAPRESPKMAPLLLVGSTRKSQILVRENENALEHMECESADSAAEL